MTNLDFLNKNYPIRKTEKEKESFRKYVIDTLKSKGIDVRVETTNNGMNKNIIVGDPTSAKAVFCAHYDTPCRSLFPNIMIPKNRALFFAYQFVPVIFLLLISLTLSYLFGIVLLNDERAYMLSFLVIYYGTFLLMMRAFKNPNNFNDNTSGVATVLSIIEGLEESEREKVAFILFDNEEKGKKGSAAYFKDHKNEMTGRFLVNFDCVANGENILFIAQKSALENEAYSHLKAAFEGADAFNVDFCTYKEADSNSDHKNFPAGVGCVACKQSRSGVLYTPYIHTPSDTVANNVNIDFLTKKSICFVQKLH